MQHLPTHPSKRHPLTGAPLHAVMIRKDGRPVWPHIGAALDDPPKADDPPKGDPPKSDPPKGDPPTSDDPPKGDPPKGDPPKPDDDSTDWKAEARKWEQRSKDNKTASDAAAQQVEEFKDAIAKALGLKEDDNPDPKKLAGDLTAAQQEARQTKVENAVLRSAITEGASPDKLTDSRKFMTKLESLDPAADDFGQKVSEAIKAAVETDPTLKTAAPAPPKSGDEVNGGGSGSTGDKSVEDYVAEVNKPSK